MSHVDVYGRHCDENAPGREVCEPGTPDTRTMANRDRLICVGNPYFVPFLWFMVTTEDWEATEVIRCIDRPWRWQQEFTKFLEVSRAQKRID